MLIYAGTQGCEGKWVVTIKNPEYRKQYNK